MLFGPDMKSYRTVATLHRTFFASTRSYLKGMPVVRRVVSSQVSFVASISQPRPDTVLFQAATSVIKAKPAAMPTTTPILTPIAQAAASPTYLPPKKVSNARFSWRATLISLLSLAVSGVAVAVAGGLLMPHVYYKLFPGEAVPVISQTEGTPLGGSFTGPQALVAELSYQPPFDASLPTGDWIVIPRIGVRTELRQTADADEALNKGVWWVPDFGQPGDTAEPMIVAAHRYGWKWWWNTLADPNDPQSSYALRNSFYNLPVTEPGDQIEVISGQRKYIYEIYSGEENNEITDYDADLILYTCKFLNSPLRHVRYARLINPETNTQGTNESTVSGELVGE